MGCNTPGQGPAYVLAPHGFAMAGSAMPVNPERLPGASDTAYLNLNNLSAMRDTFRQGIIEQHLFLDALSKLTIDPATLARVRRRDACRRPGDGVPVRRQPRLRARPVDGRHVHEPRHGGGACASRPPLPTGAGGYWSHFVLITPLIPDAAGKVGTVLLGTQSPSRSCTRG